MDKDKSIKLFEQKTIRTHWDEEQEKWCFSIVDVVQVLTDSVDGRKYWNKLKQRLKEEGNETVTNCHQLKMIASDGKMRLTDVADTTQLLRLIQSIPSPKAEPFKMWLAQVGSERLDETADPELAIERALQTYLKNINKAPLKLASKAIFKSAFLLLPCALTATELSCRCFFWR